MTTTVTTGGGGFMGTLCLVFIILKLTGVIAWSWFWVLAPILWPFYLIWYILVVAFWSVLALFAAIIIGALVGKLLG